MNWKPWGDHPAIVAVMVACTLLGAALAINDHLDAFIGRSPTDLSPGPTTDNATPIPPIPVAILDYRSNAETSTIGEFTATISSGRFLFGNSAKTFSINLGQARIGENFFIVADLYKRIACVDGTPNTDASLTDYDNPQLLELTEENANEVLKSLDQYRFAFFSPTRSTVAFLQNFAGASGGSTQKRFLIDTTSNKYAVIVTGDCVPPIWIETDRYPPMFATIRGSYIGGHATMLGANPKRISEIFVFRDNQFVRSEDVEREWFKRLYDQSILSAGEISYLKKRNMDSLYQEWDNPETTRILRKLLDNIHYAKESNRIPAVVPVIMSFDRSVQKELEELLDENPFN